MSREIKFRAWSPEHNKMFCPVGIYYDGGVFDDSNTILYNAVPMQFTGLLDKNGREIYEGDILKDHCKNVGGPYMEAVVFPVTFMDGCFSVETKKKAACLYQMSPFSFLEVIGNIYESPEFSSYQSQS